MMTETIQCIRCGVRVPVDLIDMKNRCTDKKCSLRPPKKDEQQKDEQQ